MTCFHAGITNPMMISRKYSAISARILAIYVVLTLLIPVQEKFLVADVVNRFILVCHVASHVEKLRKPLIMSNLAYAISVVKEDTLHVNAPLVLHHLAYAANVEKEDTLLMNAVLLRRISVGKRNRESSTPNVRPRRENKEFLGHKSAPHDHGKSPKRKKMQNEEKGHSTPRKAKQRGVWITEDL